MSSRNPGNLWPFKKLENGMFDLDQWNDEYWARFENLLQLTVERDIIVQVEIWDPWDLFKSEAALGHGPLNVGWESSPYNPVLNVNYTAETSRLDIEIDYYTAKLPSSHKFFFTVPELENNPVVRQYQEAFIDKLLSISLNYPNVLYCMNNETGEPAEWGEYWAKHIRNRAGEAGREVFLADMRRNSNFSSEEQIKLLNEREPNEAFCLAQQGKQYAIYFTDGGEVVLDLSRVEGKFDLRWLNISQSEWQESIKIEGTKHVRIVSPGSGQWAALILPLK